MKDVFSSFIFKLTDALAVATLPFRDVYDLQDWLRNAGWDTAQPPTGLISIAQLADVLATKMQALGSTPTLPEVLDLLHDVNSIYVAVRTFAIKPGDVLDSDFATALSQQFASDFLEQLLTTSTESLLPLLQDLGLVNTYPYLATNVRRAYQQTTLDWAALQQLLSQPLAYMQRLLMDEDNLLNPGLLLRLFSDLARVLGLNPAVLDADQLAVANFGVGLTTDDGPSALTFSLLPNSQGNPLSLGASITPFVGVTTPAGYCTTDDDGEDHPGVAGLNLGVSVQVTATATPIEQQLGIDTKLTLYPPPNGDLLTVIASQQYVKLTSAVAGVHTTAVTADPLVEISYTPAQLLILLGHTDGTNLTADGITLAFGVLKNNRNEQDFNLRLTFNNAVLTLKGSDGDSFLAQVLPTNCSIPVPLALSISRKGIYFTTASSFTANITKTIKLGPLSITQLTASLKVENERVILAALADLKVTLGPVQLSVAEVGAVLQVGQSISPDALLAVSTAFQAPKGIGIEVNSDLVTGGGYLFLDPVNHQYAGAANLTLKTAARDINLNALGLLQTQLPGKPDDYSLLLLITAQFSPIQLGLGFTLNGLGGLVGVNRAADTDFLRGMVRRGEIKRLLFPANVTDDPAGALALIDTAFPSTEGRYIIGLLGELGWGTPNLITLDVALLLEFPAPLKVLLLGVLQVILPDERANTLKLRADFLGFVDFGAKKASFDAALSDSHIMSFALTGDMAFRLYQGNNPLFVITAGGFHPAFQPPAGAALTGLRRLTLALSKSDDLQLTLASYFAVTSNTVQFGSHLDLYLRICRGLSVEGHFGFDVLFQFQPFRLLAHVEAGVAIKSGRRELLSVHLSLDVTGPGPWHVWGEASFRILFIKISFDVNATIGSSAAAPGTLPAPNVHEHLVTALKDPTSWAVEAPSTTARPGGITLRPASATAGELFIDPRGALVVRQRVAPLGVKLEKYGNSTVAPIGGQRFDLLGIILGDNDLHDGNEVEATKEFFAPDQYRVLTDGQKLSLPSFQSLWNGLRLKRLAGLKAAGKATRRVVEYEKKMIGGLPTGAAPKVQPLSNTFQQLAQGSTLSRAVRAEKPSARSPKPVGWKEDTYEVVHAADLNYYDAAHKLFGSQVEAEQYRLALANSAELLVVPSYQMELA